MAIGYAWRALNAEQRKQLLEWRKARGYPEHSPPHFTSVGVYAYHISAACFEHSQFIGRDPARIEAFSAELLNALKLVDGTEARAWCMLPNHYHLVVVTGDLKGLVKRLGQVHGRSARAWNRQEGAEGRKVFYRAMDRWLRTERHYWASVNYVHNNPVRHGYVKRWTDWPWSSAGSFLKKMGRENAERIWREYPLENYGDGWDAAEL